MTEPRLSCDSLSKRFGGVAAVDGVSLALAPMEMRALIGPNGAGKSTLVGLLSGETVPTTGSVLYKGKDITRLTMPERARLGLVRSFQTSAIIPAFTAEDNVALALQAKLPHSFSFWRPAKHEPELREPARQYLEQVGLRPKAAVLARSLAYGEQRQLEIAMALASQPDVLLLDEPMAGLGPSESKAMVELLRSLRGKFTLLLIEHDMDVVFKLADRITVLVYGREMATDVPEAIRAHQGVVDAYLGVETHGH